MSCRLDETKFFVWCKTIVMSLTGMDFDSHLVDPPLSTKDSKYLPWKLDDSKIFVIDEFGTW